jgi:hypothetical protein
LMGGRPRDHRHSWVVNQDTGRPTGYAEQEMHPQFLSNAHIIKTSLQLENWLRENGLG